MRILGIIPARYASTRFPGKPLILIDGKSMIQRVYEQAMSADVLAEVCVATDDERIYHHVQDFGGKVYMTPETLTSGTGRCGFVVENIISQGNSQFDAVLNIQGDEPYIQPSQIQALCRCFDNPEVSIATLGKEIHTQQELFNPNIVKVIRDKDNFALFFSRTPLPYQRAHSPEDWVHHHKYLKHIGLYGFLSPVLRTISKMETSPLAMAESLEQLSWLENGMKIYVTLTDIETQAIDTPEDLLKFNPDTP